MTPHVILSRLRSHKQFALGTVDDDGRPWVVCLNLTLSPELDFIWESKFDTVHSKNLHQHPEVSICVFSETKQFGDFGFYAYATAKEISDKKELEKLLTLRYSSKNKPTPPITKFLGPAPMRLYRAKLTKAWVNDDGHVKTKAVLNVLRQRAKQR